MNTENPFSSIGSIFGNLNKRPDEKNSLVINPNFIIGKQKDDLKEIAENVGFSTNAFMMLALPTRKLKDNPFAWEKENIFCKLTLTKKLHFEIPWGCYARINQIFVDTEIKKTGSPIIHLGNCFNDYVKKLNYKEGYANKALLKQLINYLTLRIDIEPKKNWNNSDYSNLRGLQTLISESYDISFDSKNPYQMFLENSFVQLNEKYASYVFKHAVPLNMEIIEKYKNDPLAIDFFRFLAYRNNNLNKEVSFSDKVLFEQFGSDIENIRVTRFKCRKILEDIKKDWPVQAKLEDGYFWMAPSEPCVKKLPPTPKKLITQSLNIPNDFLLNKILELTQDDKSEDYFIRIVKNCSENSINLAIEDMQTYLSSGRKIKNKGAFFVKLIKKYNPDFHPKKS